MNLDTLLERLRNDRFTDGEHADDSKYVAGWNACSRNAERHLLRWAQEQRIEIGLTELVEWTR